LILEIGYMDKNRAMGWMVYFVDILTKSTLFFFSKMKDWKKNPPYKTKKHPKPSACKHV